jgi:hypothetical protein
MSKTKSYIEDWLDRYGKHQGFSMSFYPKIEDMKLCEKNDIDAQDYNRVLEKRKEKWYLKGEGVFTKEQIIKKMKEDIIPDGNQTSEKGYKYLLEEDPFGVNSFFDYVDSIFKKKGE